MAVLSASDCLGLPSSRRRPAMSAMIGPALRAAVCRALVFTALLAALGFGRPVFGQDGGDLWQNLGGVNISTLNYPPTCVSWGVGRIDCFVESKTGSMSHIYWNGSTWSDWEPLGGQLTGAISCTTWAKNRIDCFAVWGDDFLWHQYWGGTAWGSWESLGGGPAGGLVGKPSCVSWGANRIDCFVQGADKALWHKWWDGAAWGGWESLGGTLQGNPSCVSWGVNRIDCLALGYDPSFFAVGVAVKHRWWDGAAWGGWESLSATLEGSSGATPTSDPDCVSWGVNRVDCFVKGSDNVLYHQFWDSSTWSGWQRGLVSDGAVNVGPSCVASQAFRVDCFVLSGANGILHTYWSGAWGDWDSILGLGRTAFALPNCVSAGVGTFDCFVVVQDDESPPFGVGFWHSSFRDGGWQKLPSRRSPPDGLGENCSANSDCVSTYCDVGWGTSQTSLCMPRGGAGRLMDPCSNANQCASGYCGSLHQDWTGWLPGQCAETASSLGKFCAFNSDCVSTYCDVGSGTSQTSLCMPRGGAGKTGEPCSNNNQCSNNICQGLYNLYGSWSPGSCN